MLVSDYPEPLFIPGESVLVKSTQRPRVVIRRWWNSLGEPPSWTYLVEATDKSMERVPEADLDEEPK